MHLSILLTHRHESYILDVGFGSNLALQPIPLTGKFVTFVTGHYRIIPYPDAGGEYVYEKYVNGERTSCYYFTLDAVNDVYVNQVKQLIETHPASSFNKSLLLYIAFSLIGEPMPQHKAFRCFIMLIRPNVNLIRLLLSHSIYLSTNSMKSSTDTSNQDSS